jgi:hypothetical protein
METGIIRMRQVMDWVNAKERFMPEIIRVYTGEARQWMDATVDILSPIREFLMQNNNMLSDVGELVIEMTPSEDEEPTMDEEDEESEEESDKRDDGDDDSGGSDKDRKDRKREGKRSEDDSEQSGEEEEVKGKERVGKRKRSPMGKETKRVRRANNRQDIVAKAPLEHYVESGEKRSGRKAREWSDSRRLTERMQEGIFHTGSLLDIMEGQIAGNARYLTILDIQREDTDNAEVNMSKNAWLQIDKEWLKVREEMLDINEYLKLRETEMLIGEDLRVAICMMGRNNKALMEIIQDQAHLWPEFICVTADEVGKIIGGMKKEWDELKRRSARNKLTKVVSPIAFMRRQAKTVRELKYEQRMKGSGEIREKDATEEEIMITGMPVVNGVNITRRHIIFKTPQVMEENEGSVRRYDEYRKFMEFENRREKEEISKGLESEVEEETSTEEQMIQMNEKDGKQAWDGIMDGNEWEDTEINEIYEKYKSGGKEERRIITEFIRTESIKLGGGLWEKLEGVIENGDSFETKEGEQREEEWMTEEEREVQSFFVKCDLPWGYSCAKPQVRTRANIRTPGANERTMKRYVQNMPLREDVTEVQTMENGEFTTNAEVNVFSPVGDGRQLPLTQFEGQKYYDTNDGMDELYTKLCNAANTRMSIPFEYEVAKAEFYNQCKSENVIHLTQMHDTEGLAVMMVTVIEGNKRLPKLIPLPIGLKEAISEQFVKEKVSKCAYFPNVHYKTLYQPSICLRGCVNKEVVIRSRTNRARPKYMIEITGEWLGSEERTQEKEISRVPEMMMMNVEGGRRTDEGRTENVRKALQGLLSRYHENRKKAEQRTSTPQPGGEGEMLEEVNMNPEELADIMRTVERIAVVTKRNHGVQVTAGWQKSERKEDQGTSGTSRNQDVITGEWRGEGQRVDQELSGIYRGQGPQKRLDTGLVQETNVTDTMVKNRCPAVLKQFWEMYKDKAKIGRAKKVDCTDTFKLQMEKVDAVFDQLDDITDEIRIFILMQLLDTDATALAKDMKVEVRTNYAELKEALTKELGDELKIMELQNRLVNMRQTDKQSVTDFYRTCRDPLNRIYNRMDFPNDEVRNALMMQKFVAALYYESTKAYVIGSGIETVTEACEKADKYEYNMKLCSQANRYEGKEEEGMEFRTEMQQQIEELKRVQMSQMNQFMIEKAAKQAVGGLVAKSYVPANTFVAKTYPNKMYNTGNTYQNKAVLPTATQFQGKKPFVDYRNQARIGGYQKNEEGNNKGSGSTGIEKKMVGSEGYAKKANGNCVECDARQGHTSYCSQRRIGKVPSMAMMGVTEDEKREWKQGYDRYVDYMRYREDEQREESSMLIRTDPPLLICITKKISGYFSATPVVA